MTNLNFFSKGRVASVSEEQLYLISGTSLFVNVGQANSWQKISALPIQSLSDLFSLTRLGRRLARAGIHHLVAGNKFGLLINGNQNFFHLPYLDNTLQRQDLVVGSRPMALCAVEGTVYYGEYRSNGGFDGVDERTPIHVWKSNGDGVFKPVWQFKNVRHIHAISHDSFTNRIWVTTGDRDEESALWYTDDDFATLNKFVGGSQQYRAIQLLFTESHIYFGSDAPNERNFIYRIHKETKELDRLQEVAGPVFYACQTGGCLFFSTAVEPSEVNTSPYAELWGSKNGKGWKCVVALKKDRWSMKYFQYGQILFPSGRGDGKYLWFTPRATEHDEKTFRIPLNSIFNE